MLLILSIFIRSVCKALDEISTKNLERKIVREFFGRNEGS
jgi:hypothetical protein